ncbi:MAG TPA: monooxygenase [Paenalcaligenes hominis]|uniref:2-octaprenyl-6-methoxyphenol hydroxylase n=1 Tax=Paenalcaligenes hominis TaxID=643674 RepID=A0A9D3AB33_9BURK|nr:monooxygenase [Paenalcaligenes hominis]NJB66248.1 2-octaprenyl-6-methoxyphenol hydroxylase [Paenalcaligenes hominis]GGE74368.1 monooxygenase [Paenalcaligenes hominis]HJH24828.1 monooxygenase [Paenalcaligenes hominis]
MTRPDFDIAICGAGPVGCAVALLLQAQHPDPSRIAVFGQAAPAQGQKLDPRTLALNHGSQKLLEPLSAWPAPAAAIRHVHVSQKGRLGRTVITPEELGVQHLGHVVNYDDLVSRLRSQLQHSPVHYLEVEHPVSVQSLGHHAHVSDASISYTARVAIQSDGARPQQIQRDYNQYALLATVQSQRPQSEWAYERFTAHGPLALLPHPNQADCYALVWCNSPARTHYLLELDAAEFERELLSQFGARLGRLHLVSERFSFPLTLAAGPSLPSPYQVAIGNAAQTLHPVAGQGLNLGLRDVGQLALSLKAWQAQPHTDIQPYLHQYSQQRKTDRWLTGSITDTLPRLFATSNPLIQHACGLGLLSMDLIAGARLPLARQLLQGLRI